MALQLMELGAIHPFGSVVPRPNVWSGKGQSLCGISPGSQTSVNHCPDGVTNRKGDICELSQLPVS